MSKSKSTGESDGAKKSDKVSTVPTVLFINYITVLLKFSTKHCPSNFDKEYLIFFFFNSI